MNSKEGMFDFFSVLVIGNNPDDILSKYDMMLDTKESYILYKYSDIKTIRKNRIKIYKDLLEKATDPELIKSIKKTKEKKCDEQKR
jgi:hypothetical protein